MYATHRLMVIHPCAKYGKPMSNHKKVMGRTRICTDRRTDSYSYIIKIFLENGVIVPSKSDWASAPDLVRKTNGTVRYCVDFRKVNSLTKKDALPLTNIEEYMDTLSGNVFKHIRYGTRLLPK